MGTMAAIESAVSTVVFFMPRFLLVKIPLFPLDFSYTYVIRSCGQSSDPPVRYIPVARPAFAFKSFTVSTCPIEFFPGEYFRDSFPVTGYTVGLYSLSGVFAGPDILRLIGPEGHSIGMIKAISGLR
jgi:hypothetical protein